MHVRDLEGYGFNLSEAMELCINDEEIYREVLETFLEEGREKIPFMQELMNSKDYERYIIEAHGLKNAARQIGADELSEIGKASEFAGKAGEIDKLIEYHENLIDAYQETLDIIAGLF